jgi:hypothetical protein
MPKLKWKSKVQTVIIVESIDKSLREMTFVIKRQRVHHKVLMRQRKHLNERIGDI